MGVQDQKTKWMDVLKDIRSDFLQRVTLNLKGLTT